MCFENDVLSEQLVNAMYSVLDVSEEMFARHGDGCECYACETASGLFWVVKNATVMLEDDLAPFGRSAERSWRILHDILANNIQADAPLVVPGDV